MSNLPPVAHDMIKVFFRNTPGFETVTKSQLGKTVKREVLVRKGSLILSHCILEGRLSVLKVFHIAHSACAILIPVMQLCWLRKLGNLCS